MSRTATRGRKVSTVSSWKLEASTTQMPRASPALVQTASASGSPRLPPTKVGRPVARRKPCTLASAPVADPFDLRRGHDHGPGEHHHDHDHKEHAYIDRAKAGRDGYRMSLAILGAHS